MVALTLTTGSPAPAQRVDTDAARRVAVEEVAMLLRNRVEAAGAPPRLAVGEERIHAAVALPRFYEGRIYRPAWVDERGPLPRAHSLTTALARAHREGLRPSDYHEARIRRALAEVRAALRSGTAPEPRRFVDLELLLTDAFLLYASHLLAGRVDPVSVDAEWRANRRELDLVPVLEGALASGEVGRALDALRPPQRGYVRMREALARYREAAARGGWPTVPDGPTLRAGDTGERVTTLWRRLAASDDLRAPADGATGDEGGRALVARDTFDVTLEAALRRFQARHGLEVDGAVGSATLAALNVPASERVQQLRLNMERWRWLPQDLGRRHIVVNIAEQELGVVEDGLEVMTMRVVVGLPYRRTPVFSDRVTYLVFSPYWHVPPGIAGRDVLPDLRRDPGYAARMNMKVLRGWGADAREVDPRSVDWAAVSAANMPYRFRQEPGPTNALGRVKFMFPNAYNVYLHDSAARGLFARAERAFSSGCVRVERPLELAEYLLRGRGWTIRRMQEVIDRRVEHTVPLEDPVPVHLLYWTAWAERDGSIHFRRDLYDRDGRLSAVLGEPPPGPADAVDAR